MSDKKKLKKYQEYIQGYKDKRKELGTKKFLEFAENVDNRKKKFTGPKATENSLGDSVNKFREKDDEIDKLFPYSKGGRAGFKVGGAAKRGVSKILRKK